MNIRDKYWKCEYENLRRKKNKEIEQMKLQQSQVIKNTLKVFEHYKIPFEEAIKFYEKNTNN